MIAMADSLHVETSSIWIKAKLLSKVTRMKQSFGIGLTYQTKIKAGLKPNRKIHRFLMLANKV